MAFLASLIGQLKTLTGNGTRERSDMQQRGRELNPGPLQQGQSLCTWDATLPTELKGTPIRRLSEIQAQSQHIVYTCTFSPSPSVQCIMFRCVLVLVGEDVL